jgi:hypothetical protein
VSRTCCSCKVTKEDNERCTCIIFKVQTRCTCITVEGERKGAVGEICNGKIYGDICPGIIYNERPAVYGPFRLVYRSSTDERDIRGKYLCKKARKAGETCMYGGTDVGPIRCIIIHKIDKRYPKKLLRRLNETV